MDIYMAFPFLPLLNPQTGLLDQQVEDLLRGLIAELEQSGNRVFCAHLVEDFGRESSEPEAVALRDFEAVRRADLIVAFPWWKTYSCGVHVELGVAATLNKPMVIFLDSQQSYSSMVTGLGAIANVRFITVDDWSPEKLIPRTAREVEAYVSLMPVAEYSETRPLFSGRSR